jgi:hypothetical protein
MIILCEYHFFYYLYKFEFKLNFEIKFKWGKFEGALLILCYMNFFPYISLS